MAASGFVVTPGFVEAYVVGIPDSAKTQVVLEFSLIHTMESVYSDSSIQVKRER